MIRKRVKHEAAMPVNEITVPVNLYLYLQAVFVKSNAQRCADYALQNRLFHPGDKFTDMIRWLWSGVRHGEQAEVPPGGEALACTLLADHFGVVNWVLADLDPPAAPMTIEEMITGLRIAGLAKYLGPRQYQRVCQMIRDDVPEMSGYDSGGKDNS